MIIQLLPSTAAAAPVLRTAVARTEYIMARRRPYIFLLILTIQQVFYLTQSLYLPLIYLALYYLAHIDCRFLSTKCEIGEFLPFFGLFGFTLLATGCGS